MAFINKQNFKTWNNVTFLLQQESTLILIFQDIVLTSLLNSKKSMYILKNSLHICSLCTGLEATTSQKTLIIQQKLAGIWRAQEDCLHCFPLKHVMKIRTSIKSLYGKKHFAFAMPFKCPRSNKTNWLKYSPFTTTQFPSKLLRPVTPLRGWC